MHSKTETIPESVEALRYPWDSHPGAEQVVEVAPGVLWLRLKLPFRLNHVNIYLVADGDGWAMIDSGFGNEATIAAWTALFEGALAKVRISRLIVTHAHPDHLGLAGWIVERFQCPFYMSQIEYLQGVYHQNRRTEERVQNSLRFFRRHGMDDSIAMQLVGRGQDYLKKTAAMPAAYRRLSHGDEIAIGARSFRIITGAGHSPDQVMLYCAADKLFLSADQVLSKISPNVSVWAHEPDENALGAYLRSLKHLADTLPDDVLVLPGHGVPFYGVKARIAQLSEHHQERCDLIAQACRKTAMTSADLVPVVFNKHVLDAHQTGFAAGELIAHVNYMLAENRLKVVERRDGLLRFKSI
ncbi:glyoxylase-like metal-dependent hydrolase (beta-lactamase superfamily II) [Rhodopseudomonas rhenobacensis]|uniref:Glyoxylase-like metal-dependent hydrolase (Beta-lactamase superfamily II) n=1 Tax=Rhodopseudomonas rhenobacensis TaxID=87461 RepID=A0A7W7Z7G6_9BRAD|nr:MBL fold metallo-hydrolase [Rhodopseudomonas rhenobacensis]MBB5049230.1 glyoxylase-like metal-dependent hydrolase (beta-lactamase superfamily II) [Rhodopseudomonas rhenobacensis]